ncbi:MAG TPA: permease [Alphaproteobacteria bacterium]|nr:permease [Alphaproteobacteria bacterium]
MQIYLPVAELSVNIFLLLGMGAAVGFLSGMFGVGGGFLMTPLLIFAGVPPAVAVGTEANQIVAASFSGVLAHWKRAVDFKMGLVLLAGGAMGSTIGVTVFSFLRGLGQIDLAISLAYVLFLGTVGALMLVESVNAMRQSAQADVGRRKLHRHLWMHGLPFKMRFRKSKLYISALLPIMIGFVVGILAAIMGVSGGFIMVPAMIYLLGMPTSVVVGTSLFQITFVAANVTFLQAANNHTVDVLLALILLIGGALGAQVGAKIGGRLRTEQLRILLSLLVLGMGVNVAYGLIHTPGDVYSITGAAP